MVLKKLAIDDVIQLITRTVGLAVRFMRSGFEGAASRTVKTLKEGLLRLDYFITLKLLLGDYTGDYK